MIMSRFTILSYNICGVNNPIRQTELRIFLSQHQPSVLVLQEPKLNHLNVKKYKGKTIPFFEPRLQSTTNTLFLPLSSLLSSLTVPCVTAAMPILCDRREDSVVVRWGVDSRVLLLGGSQLSSDSQVMEDTTNTNFLLRGGASLFTC